MSKRAFMMVKAKDLTIVPELQRDVRKSLVTRISDGWDLDRCGVLDVAELDHGDHTVWHVIDGQHRWAAAMGLDPEMELPCFIRYDLDEQGVASAFVGRNEVRGNVSAYDQYRVGLRALEPNWVHVDAAVTKAGVSLGQAPSTNVIGAVAGCRKIVEEGHKLAQTLGYPGAWGYGRDHLVDVIRVIKKAWPSAGADRWTGHLLEGVARFMRTNHHLFGAAANRDRLVAILKAEPPAGWNARLMAHLAGSTSGSAGRPIAVADMLTADWEDAHPSIPLA